MPKQFSPKDAIRFETRNAGCAKLPEKGFLSAKLPSGAKPNAVGSLRVMANGGVSRDIAAAGVVGTVTSRFLCLGSDSTFLFVSGTDPVHIDTIE